MDFEIGDGSFPVGTVVKAYEAANWPQSKLPVSGAPIGEVVSEATIAVGGTTIEDLEEGVAYYVTAQVGGTYRYLRVEPRAVPATLAELTALVEEQGELINDLSARVLVLEEA